MLVLIRGAGDLASGIALRLWRCGFSVVMTELARPLTIRRTVAFSDAVSLGRTRVEEAEAVLAPEAAAVPELLARGKIALLVDPEAACRLTLKPEVLVDAILAKKNLGTAVTDAPLVVGVGPGFTAEVDCHAVVETMRGHTLGRAIYEGAALPNTNIPGLIGGFAGERVLRAPADGVFTGAKRIGDRVKAGEVAGYVDGVPMVCTIDGVLRGLLADGIPVRKGLKSGDVDPRGDPAYCHTVSDKALAIAGGILEAILHLTNLRRHAEPAAESNTGG